MKFLPLELVRPNMIPLNIVYYNPISHGGTFNDDDVLTITYKDLDSGQKFVHDLKNPEIEIYIVKPENRTFTHMRDMITMDECHKFKVPYKSRWNFAAKKLNLDSADMAKASPYVFNADLPIETYYLIQFVMEYSTESPKALSLGKLDIENDIIACEDFPLHGETPINAVTYINMDTNDVYTLILLKDNLPFVPEGHPKYEYYRNLKEKFYTQVDEVNKNPQMVVNACHSEFDEMYPGMKYNLLYYTEELQLLKDLMYIIHNTDNDYIGIWNMPYDMQNIISRPSRIGGDPFELIPDDRFSIKMVSFKEDTNPVAHKRRHECVTSTVPTFVDDMVHYAGVRSGRGVIPSLKLNNVARSELKDEKFDYSEISDIKHLFYDDLLKFILYNIKDVLLLVSLEKKTKDTSTIYSRMYQMCVFPKEAFTTTKVVWHSLIKFMYERGYVPGTNRNKGKNKKGIIDYSAALSNQLSDDLDEEDFEDTFFSIEEPDLGGDDNGEEKEEKYQGAFVMNTLHMQPTNIEVMGKPAKYIHDNVADLDVSSEYPTAINTCDISNETLVAKVYLENPDEVDIPICKGFVFRGNDLEKYKMDKGNYLLETYTEGDTFNFSSLFLGLPTPDTILQEIKSLVD